VALPAQSVVEGRLGAASIPGLRRRVLIALAGTVAFGAAPIAHASSATRTEVVITLAAPSLADAVQESRVLTVRAKAERLDLEAPSSVSYLHELTRQQDTLARRIEHAIPSATVRWRYRVVLDGLAVVVPTRKLAALSRIAGVSHVYPDTTYRVKDDTSPTLLGADQLWGLPDFSTAGQGVKIGVVDEGIDQAHPFFNPAGYVYPAGFPKGNTAFTTPKVIVARAFAPPGETWKYASTPFDPVYSDHATHVAGIAAGDYLTTAGVGQGPLAGIAPRAYLGNYKALTVPTGQFGLDGNAPEIAAAVEAAVTDGMDVINLSIGEPEIEPASDIVAAAIDGAARAGVVSTVAAGNYYEEYGRGSIDSPGSAAGAITAAAVTKGDVIAPFSGSGPTPVSLAMKPDVSAPGVSILSSVPPRERLWAQLSGTSMAAPQVAGAAALLRQRHPDWSVAQIKSALVLTGKPVLNSSQSGEAPATREGGGLLDLPEADNPLVFADPTGISFGLLRAGKQATRIVSLTDAGAGAGAWTVSVDVQDPTAGVSVTAPTSVTVPAALTVQASASAGAKEADVTGFVVLQRGPDLRRIPFWLRSERPRLEKPSAILRKAGNYKGNTLHGASRVSAYRYPDNPAGARVAVDLPGPEQVFRVVLPGRVRNFGVVVTGHAAGVSVSPRIVFPGDENHVVGDPALPTNVDPYQDSWGQPEPVAAVIAPASRAYDVVFDTRSRSEAGPFTFHLWMDDAAPPTAKLLNPAVTGSGRLVVSVEDKGSGVDPDSIVATIDGSKRGSSYAGGRVSVELNGLSHGTHTLVLTVSDYQETKNMETFGHILPNTRVYRASFRVR
jgi:subtilisin family serine protease